LGAGFAGLWSAVGAARKLDELGIRPDGVEVVVVNLTAWHCIRVRKYEDDLGETRVRLDAVLDPIGVKHVEGEITDIDFSGRRVIWSAQDTSRSLR
jgi:NADH:ubiquinone reductase (H+-translocating)